SWARLAGSGAGQLKKELSDMSEVRTQARFQKAVALGETPQALAQFMEFCQAGVLVEKSCENARVLSVKLKDQEALIAVLEKMGASRQAELAQELEAAGYFARSAGILEKIGSISKAKDATGLLKIALLWELSGDQKAFGRSVLSIRDSRIPLDQNQEALWLSMVLDIGEKDPAFALTSILKALRFDSSRERLSEWLQARGRGTSETQKVILSSKFQTGPAWRQLVISEIESGMKAAQGISFYGRNSKSQFEKRLAAMVRLAKRADEFFPKCDPQTKSALATILKTGYESLALEIRQSPIPPGVPEEAVPELKAGLEEMAKPFDDKAAVFAQVIMPADVPGGTGSVSDRIG
ncbi:hypothetical protein EBZ37_14985, partial [bacterium]|nr:hypothetical protein [bacterium]